MTNHQEVHIKTMMRYHLTFISVKKVKKNKKKISAGKDVEKLELSSFADGIIKWFTHCGRSLKIKHRAAI